MRNNHILWDCPLFIDNGFDTDPWNIPNNTGFLMGSDFNLTEICVEIHVENPTF